MGSCWRFVERHYSQSAPRSKVCVSTTSCPLSNHSSFEVSAVANACMRCIIWILSKIVPRGTGLWEELIFLLGVVDVVSFLVLDLHNTEVADLPFNLRIAAGLFQASSTRTAGFAALPVNLIHPAVQTLEENGSSITSLETYARDDVKGSERSWEACLTPQPASALVLHT